MLLILDPHRANCGQGAPEVGPLPGGTERPTNINLTDAGLDVLECRCLVKGLRLSSAHRSDLLRWSQTALLLEPRS